MEIAATIATAKSLLVLGKEISAILQGADGTEDLTKCILLYLESTETAVSALGLERQRILTDLRQLDVSNPEQVSAVWSRLGMYLHEDNIRPILGRAIGKLDGYHAAIGKQAEGLRWRERDKAAAVTQFTDTLYELKEMLRRLTSNFYPGMSAMGVHTLQPIYRFLDELRKGKTPQHADLMGNESIDEALADLVRKALQDPSHDEWVHSTGKIGKLVSELQWAFR